MPGVESPNSFTEPRSHRESIRSPTEDTSARKARAPRAAEARLALTDPAAGVVTDFIWEQPITVRRELSIDDALREMIRAGVRALLVVRDEVVTGLITSYDIQGERPLQFLTESGYRRHDEIEVGHIMTPWEHVATLDWRALGRARVADLVAFFRTTAATHVVVEELVPAAQQIPLLRRHRALRSRTTAAQPFAVADPPNSLSGNAASSRRRLFHAPQAHTLPRAVRKIRPGTQLERRQHRSL